MNTIKTWMVDVDNALGGGLVSRGNLLIAYDKRSLGWMLGLKMFKSLIEHGAVGVVLNTVASVSKLELRLERVGLDMRKAGEEGSLYVIDLFGSKYGIRSKAPYILQIADWNEDTGIAKLIALYRKLGRKIPKGSTVVGLVATMEGLYHEFGEKIMKALIRSSFASFEQEPLSEYELMTISLLNEGAIPDQIGAWLFSINDQVVEFISYVDSEGSEEIVLFPKSVLPGFSPSHCKIKTSEKRTIELF